MSSSQCLRILIWQIIPRFYTCICFVGDYFSRPKVELVFHGLSKVSDKGEVHRAFILLRVVAVRSITLSKHTKSKLRMHLWHNGCKSNGMHGEHIKTNSGRGSLVVQQAMLTLAPPLWQRAQSQQQTACSQNEWRITSQLLISFPRSSFD